jgi:phosphoribosylanthranilate isomerase
MDQRRRFGFVIRNSSFFRHPTRQRQPNNLFTCASSFVILLRLSAASHYPSLTSGFPKTGMRPWSLASSSELPKAGGLGFNWRVDVKVKICGVTSAGDAEAAVQAGADALGLMFYAGSPRHLSLEAAQRIAAGLPPFIIRGGVFVDPDPSEVFAAIQACGLNVAQFHGAETPQFCAQFGVMTLKAFRVENAASLRPMAGFQADAFLLDSYVPEKAGGTGETFNWDLAVEAKRFGKPIFLAGGLTAQNAAEAVRKVQPFAVDVSSGVEHSPGKKDAAKMRDFIAAVRGA